MASPILPGVGTQSRIAQVIQSDNELRLRQEALNRQSGQGLLSTALQGTLGIGQLTNEAVQAALDRQQRATLAGDERAAALARIGATGEQARLTGTAAQTGRSAAERAAREAIVQETQRLETRGEPGGADFVERIRREVVTGGQARDLADIRARAARETGPRAAEELRISDRPARLSAELQTAREQAELATEFSRDPITFLTDQLKSMLETMEQRIAEGSGVRARIEFDARLPELLDRYEIILQTDPTAAERAPILELFLNERKAKQAAEQQAEEARSLEESQRLIDAAERAARVRASFQGFQERFGEPGIF